VVTNARFVSHFEEWRHSRFDAAGPSASGTADGEHGPRARRTPPGEAHDPAGPAPRVSIVNDGSTSNEDRLGALFDLKLAVDRAGVDDDALVLAGDNLFDFELSDFAAYFGHVKHDCITAHELSDVTSLRRTGVVELSEDSRVMSFEEKPSEPQSSWAVPPFYAYLRHTLLTHLSAYLAQGGEADAPGSFIPWLIRRVPVYAYRFSGGRYDIGNHESYRRVAELFRSRR
jgi:glucose-1-phosphate thymidylyltransferase